jgi:hypothetical protein
LQSKERRQVSDAQWDVATLVKVPITCGSIFDQECIKSNEWKVAAIQRGTLYPDSKLKNTKLPKLSPLQLSKMEQQRWKNGKHRDLPDHILEQQDQDQREHQQSSTRAGSSPSYSAYDDDGDDDFGFDPANNDYDMDIDPAEDEDQQSSQREPLSARNLQTGTTTPRSSDMDVDRPDQIASKQQSQELPYPIPEDPNVQIPHNFLSGLLVDRRDEVEAFIYRNTADLDLDDLSLLRQQLWDKIERSCVDQYYNNH